MALRLPIDTAEYWPWNERKLHLAIPKYLSRLILEQPGVVQAAIISGAYNPCLVAFHFFAFFGFAPEATKNYRRMWEFTTFGLKSAFQFVLLAPIPNCFKPSVRTIGVAPFIQESYTSRPGNGIIEKLPEGLDKPIPLTYSRKEGVSVFDLPTLPSTLPPAIPLRAHWHV